MLHSCGYHSLAAPHTEPASRLQSLQSATAPTGTSTAPLATHTTPLKIQQKSVPTTLAVERTDEL